MPTKPPISALPNLSSSELATGDYIKAVSRSSGREIAFTLNSLNLWGTVAETNTVADGAWTLHHGHPFLLFEGTIYGAPIISDGTNFVRPFTFNTSTKVFDDSAMQALSLDDDHNFGNVVVDPVNDTFGVLNADHNVANTVYWHRGTDLDADNVPSTATTTATVTSITYSAGFINPADLDQLDVFVREGGSSASTWRMLRTEDLDAVAGWTEYEFMDETYIDVREARGGSNDLWVAASGVPDSPTGNVTTSRGWPQSITLWNFDRTGDSLSSAGVNESADIKTGYTAIHPMGWNLLDYSEDVTGAGWTSTLCTRGTGGFTTMWGTSSVQHSLLTNNGTGTAKCEQSVGNSVVNEYYQVEAVVRANTTDRVFLAAVGGVKSPTPWSFFHLSGAGSTHNEQNIIASTITRLENDWYHIGITFQADSAVAMSYRINPTNASWALSATWAGESIGVQACQLCVNPYNGTKFAGYTQNLTTNAKNPSTATPLEVFPGTYGKFTRLMDFQETDGYVEFLWATMPFSGSNYAGDGQCEIYWTRVNTSTWAVDTPVKVADGGDGMDSAGDYGYVGGCIMGPREVLFDRQNYQGNGQGQIVRAISGDGGVTWSEDVIISSSTDKLMRPTRIDEQTYSGAALSYDTSRWFAYMKGTYTDYVAAFDTNVVLARLA